MKRKQPEQIDSRMPMPMPMPMPMANADDECGVRKVGRQDDPAK